MSHDDDGLRRIALSIASQLPDRREEALSVLNYARDLIEFLHGPRRVAPVISLATAREAEPPALG
jgi:hypothetical protein